MNIKRYLIFTFFAISMLYSVNVKAEERDTVDDEFIYELISEDNNKTTRDYARSFYYDVLVNYGDDEVCVCKVDLGFFYNNTSSVITSFTCTKGDVASGFTVTTSTSKVNGNPAVATLVIRCKNNKTGVTSTHTYKFICKVGGNVIIDAY